MKPRLRPSGPSWPAAARVEAFHRRQPLTSWFANDLGGTLGQMIRPLQRVGLYVPGGTAPLPSSVLMSAIPARVAGVKEIVVVTPPSLKPQSPVAAAVDPMILAACAIASVDEIYLLGGAQAIGALAYGTETIPRVDKIFGPGNLFVTLAKRQVYGVVGIEVQAPDIDVCRISDAAKRPNRTVVDGVSLEIFERETLGLVGESGCGKSTLARAILRLTEPTEGQVFYRDQDLAHLSARKLREQRRHLQIIFQDPYSSLNPRMTIGEAIMEPMRVHSIGINDSARRNKVIEILEKVNMKAAHFSRYPHEFSGGQRQRIGIARALALHPRLVVADEPVSALDVSVQAQVLNLMLDLQEKLKLTYLFVAHDLSVVKHISDRVCVMYVGKIVEMAATKELFQTPRHPYTAALMTAVPVPDPDQRDIIQDLPGEVASPANPPSGCYFHPRCQFAKEICRMQTPELREISPDHFVSCHRAEELQLAGIKENKSSPAMNGKEPQHKGH